MKKKVEKNKFFMQLSDGEIAACAKKRLIAQICVAVVFVAALLIPTKGLEELFMNSYLWSSTLVVGFVVAVAFAVYCLIGHFTLYKFRREVSANRLPALRGDWHTFAALEIQFLLSAAEVVVFAVLTAMRFDIWGVVAVIVSAGGAVAAWIVRDVTNKAFKTLSDKPYSPKKEEKINEEVEEFYDN